MSELESLVIDLEKNCAQLSAETDVIRELKMNLYPAMVLLGKHLQEIDGLVTEVVDQVDSYLTDELGAAILALIAAGARLAEVVVSPPVTDEVQQAGVARDAEAFQTLTQGVVEGVLEATQFEDAEVVLVQLGLTVPEIEDDEADLVVEGLAGAEVPEVLEVQEDQDG